jgi:uncharacterized protein YjbJ (UPF0337 family)
MPNQSKDKWEGRAKQAVGKGKEEVGEAIKHQEREAEGRTDQGEGKVKEKVEDIKDRARR